MLQNRTIENLVTFGNFSQHKNVQHVTADYLNHILTFIVHCVVSLIGKSLFLDFFFKKTNVHFIWKKKKQQPKKAGLKLEAQMSQF